MKIVDIIAHFAPPEQGAVLIVKICTQSKLRSQPNRLLCALLAPPMRLKLAKRSAVQIPLRALHSPLHFVLSPQGAAPPLARRGRRGFELMLRSHHGKMPKPHSRARKGLIWFKGVKYSK